MLHPIKGSRLGSDHDGGLEGVGRAPCVEPRISGLVPGTGRAISEAPSAARGARLRGITVCVLGGRSASPLDFDGARDGVRSGFPMDRVAGRANSDADPDGALPSDDDADGRVDRDDGPIEAGGDPADEAAGRLTVGAPELRLALEEVALGGRWEFAVPAGGLAERLETAGFCADREVEADAALGGRADDPEDDAEVFGRELEAALEAGSAEGLALLDFGGSASPAPATMSTTASRHGKLDAQAECWRTMIASSLEETRHVLANVQ
ncbi:MAG: hypothetical protein IT449_04030 [Phycisphaerales bacterium]|nr:hypothetical protein [Phycisphaerales bacterium]